MRKIPLSPIDHVFVGPGSYPIEFVFYYPGGLPKERFQTRLEAAANTITWNEVAGPRMALFSDLVCRARWLMASVRAGGI